MLHNVIVLFAIGVAAAGAQPVAPTIRATVSDKFVQVGEIFYLIVEMDGGAVDRFEPPTVDGLVMQVRRSQKILRGPMTVEFACKASKVGDITIPALTARIGGKDVSSEPIPIRVRAAPGGAQAGAGSSSGTFNESRQPTMEDLTFLRASVDNVEVFEGERIIFDLTWWHLDRRNVSVSATAPPSEPQFPGFYSIKQPEVRMEETSNGLPYDVFRYRWHLYPTQSGRLEIPSSKIQADVIVNMGRVYTSPVSLQTEPIAVSVKPLPPRPANFSGAVGMFEFDAATSEPAHLQGVPFDLLAVVRGDGNGDAIRQPVLPKVDWAHVTATNNEVQRHGDGTISKTFQYTLTPLKVGTHTMPELEFCYFDPEREEYVTLRAGPFLMPVAESAEAQQAMVHSSDITRDVQRVRVLSNTLLPQDVNVGELKPQRLPAVALASAAVLPPIAYVLFAMFLRRQRRFASDSAFSRAYHARQRAHDGLAKVGTAPDPVDALYRATTNFLADVTNRPEGAITYADAQALVARLPVDAATGERLLKVIRACERHRYAGAELSSTEIAALVHAAEDAADEIDAALERGRA